MPVSSYISTKSDTRQANAVGLRGGGYTQHMEELAKLVSALARETK
jgi:hypothetical protein